MSWLTDSSSEFSSPHCLFCSSSACIQDPWTFQIQHHLASHCVKQTTDLWSLMPIHCRHQDSEDQVPSRLPRGPTSSSGGEEKSSLGHINCKVLTRVFYNVTRALRDLLNHLGTTLLLLHDGYTMNLSLQHCLLARVFITKSSKFRRAAREQKVNPGCLKEKEKNQVK